MNRLLLVDDEQNVLNALQRELRTHFEIAAFTNPLQALEHCRDHQFDLVISDYKMPELNGIEFLKKFGVLQPDAARLVLSGQADIEALIRTINETHIYRFLAKPWEKAELLSSIHQALAYRATILQSRHASGRSQQNDAPYRILLVEPDAHLRSVKAHALSEEDGHASLYGAMQQESGQPSKPFKCTVAVFSTAQEALAHAQTNAFDLVITPQKLPDMAGIELLSQLKQISPSAARILISDDPNKELLSHAINDVEVQNVLQLHWTSYDMRADMRRQAWNLYQLKTAAIQALTARDLTQHSAV